MNTYIQFSVLQFKNLMAYRFEYFMGIINSVLFFFVYFSIYRALYGGVAEVEGVTFSMVVTNFLISLGLSNAFSKSESFLQNKIRQGTIANELLKPVDFKLRMLFEDFGTALFKLCFNFLPTVMIACFFADIVLPSNVTYLLLCLVSVVLGYIVLWLIGFIVQSFSFWVINVRSLVTLKNVLVRIFAGTLIPLWFLPDRMKSILYFTPFDTIYFTPVRLYLGQLQGKEIGMEFLRQLFWIGILFVISEVLWRSGIKKPVIQGG